MSARCPSVSSILPCPFGLPSAAQPILSQFPSIALSPIHRGPRRVTRAGAPLVVESRAEYAAPRAFPRQAGGQSGGWRGGGTSYCPGGQEGATGWLRRRG